MLAWPSIFAAQRARSYAAKAAKKAKGTRRKNEVIVIQSSGAPSRLSLTLIAIQKLLIHF